MASHPFALDAEVGPVGEGAVICQKYRLESLLGEGGMGTIWRAYNLQLEVPVALKLLRAGLNAAELDIFIGPDYIVTLPNEELRPVEYLFERCRTNEEVREQHFDKGSGYLLYRIIDSCVDASFPMLRKMGNKLERIEEEIFEGRSEDVVRDISNVKQEIINFRKIVRPQRAALRDLDRTRRYVPENLEVYFDDIVDASERIWDMLENYKEVVEALESTNESVISHRVNDVLRVLTSISVVVLPLTLVASIFGMNVRVPGQGSIEAFWIGSTSALDAAVAAGSLAVRASGRQPPTEVGGSGASRADKFHMSLSEARLALAVSRHEWVYKEKPSSAALAR